jgi:hypothetical protein
MYAGMLQTANNPRLFNESVIEYIREREFSDCVSRLEALYAFGSRAEAEARIGDQDWPPYFTRENLVEMNLGCERVPTIVDANWITTADLGPDKRITEGAWIGSYWRGERCPNCNTPVWEVLAEGVAVIANESLRRKCNDQLEKQFPESIIPILMARLGSEAGGHGGQVYPMLLRPDEQTIRLTYTWQNADFLDPEIIERIKDHPDAPTLGKLMSEQESWKIPDFSDFMRSFKVGVQAVSAAGDKFIPSVHSNK